MITERLIDSMGRYRTESLFIEMRNPCVSDDFPAIYTMKPFDTDNGIKSVHKIYMDSVNEYDAAMKIVGDMRHWDRLCTLKWFMEGSDAKNFGGLASWRIEKQAKEEAKVLELIKAEAETGSVTAQKTLLDHYTKGKAVVRRVGRPVKEDPNSPEAKITQLFNNLSKNKK